VAKATTHKDSAVLMQTLQPVGFVVGGDQPPGQKPVLLKLCGL
jgi:hypothetical protein